jgi:hypothetical protein
MARAGQIAQARKDCIRGCRSAAVYEHLTGACRPYKDITVGAGKHHETLGHRDHSEACLGVSMAREGRQGQTDDAA